MMDTRKPNDIFVAVLNNPAVTPFDLLSNNLNGENTSLLSKEDYKKSKFVQDSFSQDGTFNEQAFNKMYDLAKSRYTQMTNDQYLDSLDNLEYSPFDITRPKEAKTFSVGAIYGKESNPFETLKGWTGIDSINDSNLSLREIAQKNKVYDPKTDTWSEESLNDLSLLDKWFGDTLVYGQYDEDGTHIDEETGYQVKHKKGDWKVKDGKIFAEKLGDREIYGKQVVNPADLLTADETFLNKFDFFDSDSREKSMVGTTFKLAAQIAPYVVPGVNLVYGGVTAAVNLASVMPAFYKSFEGILLGDRVTDSTKVATAAESYLAKFVQSSKSDESQGSLFNYEQIGQLVADVFSQIYQQRAAASLAVIAKRPKNLKIEQEIKELTDEATKSAFLTNIKLQGKLTEEATKEVMGNIWKSVPKLKKISEQQSELAKSLNLAYMALVTTGDIYGEALESGYDRRTAGFAALAAAAGQYGIMMNNEMGSWFLDKTTGYDINTNKALTKKAVKDLLDTTKEAFSLKSKSAQKESLVKAFSGFRKKAVDIFTSPSELGENLFKHSIVEGVEEVTEQAVMDATKGIVDVMSYLGLTKKEGSFGGFSNVFSKQGLENYVANLVGGMLGGPLFEYNATKIEPAVTNFLNELKTGKSPEKIVPVTPDLKKELYQLISNGKADELVKIVESNRKYLGNNFIKRSTIHGEVEPSEKDGRSEADIIADNAINIIRGLQGTLRAYGDDLTNEEIIQKAFIDKMLVDKLMDARTITQKNVGFEGLVLNDYTELLNKLDKVNSELAELTKVEDPKIKEAIKVKEEQAKFYRDKLNDIKDGKKAQDYFDRMMMGMTREVNQAFVAVDRDSYAKIKHGVSYYDLPEKGAGLTKTELNTQWKEYVDSRDIIKDLEVATEAYLNLEKASNASIAKFTESNYDKESLKTFKNIINLAVTKAIFNLDDKDNSYKEFIEQAKLIEDNTGKKVIPWEVINIKIFEDLLDQGFFVELNSNKKITKERLAEKRTVNNKETTLEEILKEHLNNVLAGFPADNWNIELIANSVNSYLNNMSEEISSEIENLNNKNKELEANLETLNSSEKIKAEETIRINKESIKRLEDGKIPIRILPTFSQTEAQFSKIQLLLDNLDAEISSYALDKYKDYYKDNFDYISLGKKIIEIFKSEEKSKEEVIEETIKELQNSDKFYNKENLIDDISSEVVKNLDKSEILNRILADLTTSDENISSYKELALKTDEEISKIENEKFALGTKNYLMEALLEEFKAGNRDEELLILIKNTYEKIKSPFVKFAQIFGKQDSKVLDLFNINDADIKLIEDLQNNLVLLENASNEELLEEWETVDEIYVAELKQKIEDQLKLIKDPIILSIISDLNVKDKEFISSIVSLNNNLAKLENFKKSNKYDIDLLKKINEVFENSDTFISNSIYDFLKEFSVSLNMDNKQVDTVMGILKKEEFTLGKASDVSSYLSDGINAKNIKQAQDLLSMFSAVVSAMSTTEISESDPTGFIATRQLFAKNNKIKSEVLNLKTIDSTTAKLIMQNIDRINNKLGFLKILLEGNSGKLYKEEEDIRVKTNKLLLEEWKKLQNHNIKISGDSVIDDLDSILNSKESDEYKLQEIENKFFEKHLNRSKEDLLEFFKNLKEVYSSDSKALSIYNQNSSNMISKNIENISNNDFLLYLATSITVNSKDFNFRLKDILESSFNKSPFFTQEFSIKAAYASLINQNLFSEIFKSNKEKDINTSFITYVLGNAGTGKTAVVYKVLIELLKKNNPNLNIIFSAPHIDQSNALNGAVLSGLTNTFNTKILNKNDLFKYLGLGELYEKMKSSPKEFIKEIQNNGVIEFGVNENAFDNVTITTTLPDILFLDEVTHFGAHELYLLNLLSKKASENGKTFKIFAAGDTSQNGYEYDGVSFNVDYVSGIFTPKLALAIRSLNIQQRKINDYMSSISNYTRKNWSSSKDNDTIFKVIGDNITLPVFFNEDVLNGAYIINSNEVPENVVKILANNIQKNKDTKIAILDNSGYIPNYLSELFKKYNITNSNYVVYTEHNIQGAEADYFIFNTSAIKKSNSLASKIRALNTYLSRGKNGTIVLNDSPENLPFKLVQEKDDYTQNIQPLDQDTIASNKKDRVSILTSILKDYDKTKYDNFKFSTDVDNDTEELKENNLTVDEIVGKLTFTEKETLPELPVQNKSEAVSNNKDSYLVHSFYNDLNASIVKNADGTISLIKNPGSFYGLEASKLSQKNFESLIEDYISLKYDILQNKGHTYEFVLNGATIKKGAEAEFVMVKTSFDREFNISYMKEYGNPNKILETGKPYVNLFYKVKNSQGNFEYIHLATMPTLATLANTDGIGKDHFLYTRYAAFLELPINSEISIPKESFSVGTSTRMVTTKQAGLSNASRDEFTVKKLQKIPGLRFLNVYANPGDNEFSKEPLYFLFPKKRDEDSFSKFKEIYRKTQFGTAISEEKLKEMYDKYSGKIFTVITFMKTKSNPLGESANQAQIVVLKSKVRTISEIRETVRNFKRTDTNGKKRTHDISEMISLFNGSQVLDMLINLAIAKPELYEKLLKPTEDILAKQAGFDKFFKDNKESLDSILSTFYSIVSSSVKKIAGETMIDKITLANNQLKEVYAIILSTVLDAKKTSTSIDRAELKNKLVATIKNGGNSRWFYDFWHLFQLENILENQVYKQSIRGIDAIAKFAEDAGKTITEMIDFWDKEFEELSKVKGYLQGVYYNVPIKGVKGTKFTELDPYAFHLNEEYLYTDMAPEGPYFLLNSELSLSNVRQIGSPLLEVDKEKKNVSKKTSVKKDEEPEPKESPTVIEPEENLEIEKPENTSDDVEEMPITQNNLPSTEEPKDSSGENAQLITEGYLSPWRESGPSVNLNDLIQDSKEIKRILEFEDISKIENVISVLNILGGLHRGENYFNKNVSSVFKYWVEKLEEYQINPDTDGPGSLIFEYFTTKRVLQNGEFFENFIRAISKARANRFKEDITEIMENLEITLGNLNEIKADDDSFSSEMLLNMDALIKKCE